MDQPGSRTSVLPRPGLSKLPAPRSALPTPAAVHRPVTPAAGRPVSSYAGTHNVSPPKPPAPRGIPAPGRAVRPPSGVPAPGSALGHRPQTSSVSSYATPKRTSSVSYRPPSKQFGAPSGDLNLETNGFRRTSRAGSWDREHTDYSGDSSPSESFSSPHTPADNPASPLTASKKSRPSLSDRTIETLASVTPSPAGKGARRASSYQSPSASAPRPPSQLSASTMRRPSQPTTFKPAVAGTPRQVSPTKRPMSGIPATPGNRTSMLAKPKPTAAPRGTPQPKPALARANPTPAKSFQPSTPANGHSRIKSLAPPSGLAAPKTVKPAARGATSLDIAKPKTVPRPPAPQRIRTVSTSTASSAQDPSSAKSTEAPLATSSAAFRDQIAKAKADRRAAVTKSMAIPTSSQYNFEDTADPFGQNKSDGKEELRSRLDDARRDGRLNVSQMGLKEIPSELMQMYSVESMEASAVPWNEVVDLLRFSVADNEIVEIGSDVFPDVALDAFNDDPDLKPNQFGGIESLDLRGNSLMTLPIGLRRLDNLTSLNVSRNKLENWCFEVICQIPHLRELNLSNNSLTFELPSTIGMLHELESLDVHSNKLTGLPSSIKNLKKLRSLNVSDNRISDLGTDRLALLPLTELYASSNALTGALFPPSVTQVSRLQILSIANNSVAALGFAPTLSLPSIRRLDVSCNRLFMLPDMSGWQCLNNLLCEENCLEALPQGFTQLKSLKTASFEHNNIHQLDEGIKDMASLEFLSLAGNTIKPSKYMQMTTEQLKEELARRSGFSDQTLTEEQSVETPEPTIVDPQDFPNELASSPDQNHPLEDRF